MNDLEPILKYKMNDIEAKAYKLMLIYVELYKKEFPNEFNIKLSLRSDPRKLTIFKYCYKLLRETKGVIKDKDYYWYILAQFQILKLIKQNNIHALISPQILVGDKAWKRWKIWKNKIDKLKIKNDIQITDENKIINELKHTLVFLKNKKCLTLESINKRSKDLERWLSNFSISPYYIILSPWASQFIKVDINLYRPSITPNIEKFFKENFIHEFQ